MPLKLPQKKPALPKSPEALFYSLRNRATNIKSLWSQQADVLRSYYDESLSEDDVALELPTGSGKTLIALLIAEFRRQTRNERVAYLCPTRQLARQVGQHAAAYGVPAVVLLAPQAKYNPVDFGDYSTASKIAITTYSGVFNTNPRVNNAQCLILDDAHAAETYVADLWTVTVHRAEHAALYQAIVDIFSDTLPESLVHAVREEKPTFHERSSTGKVLQPHLWEKLGPLRDALAAGTDGVRQLEYSWSMLREHLEACNIYVSWDEIVLRPFMPPSKTHQPFWGASQRVYLSATLGEGGELERITGVHKIKRLPAPPEWERRNPGRRLILIPNLSLAESAAERVAADLVKLAPRTLVLCPDGRTASAIEKSFGENGVDKAILHAGDIEESLDGFTGSSSVLVLTSRYDGLDLPDESCRSMIVAGLPDATNLQERFLSDRLGATAVLRDRVRTRISQAFGRCTRNDTDYAVILLLDESLAATVAQAEFRQGMNPEVQVELEIGITNSRETNAGTILEVARSFLSDSSDRDAIESHVLGERDGVEKKRDKAADVLDRTVYDELNYLYAAWRGEWRRAFQSAKGACDKLEGDRSVRPYQALWYYFAASAAGRAAALEDDASLREASRDLLERAMACSADISWFATLRHSVAPQSLRPFEELDLLAVEAAAKHLASMGHVGSRFDRRMSEVLEQLAPTVMNVSGGDEKVTKSSAKAGNADKAARNEEEAKRAKTVKDFERGLEAIGRMLGFQADRPESTDRAAPDSLWNLDRRLFLAFEAKSGESPSKPIPADDVRQTKLHADWVRSKRNPPTGAEVIAVVVTYQATISNDALPLAAGAKYISVPALVTLAKDVVSVLRTVRNESGAAGEDAMRQRLAVKMRELRLLPSQMRARFSDLDTLPLG